MLPLFRPAIVTGALGGACLAGACDRGGDWSYGAARTVRTTLPRAEGVGVGTRVAMAGLTIGTVRAMDSTAEGVHLVLQVTRYDAPLREGLRAEVRPAGIFAPDIIALLPGPGDAPPLPDGAEIPGTPRAATAAERRAAMRVVLPALGLPSLGALAANPSADESGRGDSTAAQRAGRH